MKAFWPISLLTAIEVSRSAEELRRLREENAKLKVEAADLRTKLSEARHGQYMAATGRAAEIERLQKSNESLVEQADRLCRYAARTVALLERDETTKQTGDTT